MLSLDLNGNNKVVIFMSQDENEEMTQFGQSRRFTVVVVFLFWPVFSLFFVCLKSITVSHEGLGVGVFNVVFFFLDFQCRAIAFEQEAFFDHKCSKRCHCTRCVGRCASVIRQRSTALVPFSFGHCPFLESLSILC